MYLILYSHLYDTAKLTVLLRNVSGGRKYVFGRNLLYVSYHEKKKNYIKLTLKPFNIIKLKFNL